MADAAIEDGPKVSDLPRLSDQDLAGHPMLKAIRNNTSIYQSVRLLLKSRKVCTCLISEILRLEMQACPWKCSMDLRLPRISDAFANS